VAKLFGKHLKVDEQLALLARQCPVYAVGTPGRIQALLKSSQKPFLSIDHLVIDTERDLKQRSILEIPETRDALLQLVYGLGSSSLLNSNTVISLIEN